MYSFTQSVTCRNYQTNEANYPEILGAIQLRFLKKKNHSYKSKISQKCT